MRERWLVVCVGMVLAAGCTPSVEPESYIADAADVVDGSDVYVDAGQDAESDLGDEADSSGADDAVDAEDAVTEEPGCERVTVEMEGGEVFEAQLMETYDHRVWWWDVEDRTTVALFRASEYAAYPDDASFRFEALADIASIEDAPVDPDDECFLDFIERREFTVARSPLEGPAQILMGNEGYHRYEGGYGDFAWDFTRTDETGARYTGDGSANTDYLVWEEPVYAPVSGYVVDVVDDAPDHPPGDYPEGAANNLVGIHIGGSFYIYVLHLKQGTVPDEIQPDRLVDAGDELGLVGNSGVSLEPHLHLTMLWYDADADRSWSVPTRFREIDVAPTPAGPFRTRTFYVPETGETVR